MVYVLCPSCVSRVFIVFLCLFALHAAVQHTRQTERVEVLRSECAMRTYTKTI